MDGKEVGEVRKQLTGPEADPYVGQARLLLGQMKEQMRMGGLRQLQWKKKLGNGVNIVVASIFGQDKIEIYAPVPPIQRKGRLEEQIIESVTDIIYVWHSGFVRKIVGETKEEAFSTLDSTVVPQGVSKDGSTVFGYIQSGGQKGFYWTKEEGIVIIPESNEIVGASRDGKHLLGAARDYGIAIIYHKEGGIENLTYTSSTLPIDISADGNTVLWSRAVTEGTESHIWTREAGGTNLGILTPRGISGDGKTVYGNRLVSVGPVIFGGCVWTAETGIVTISAVPLGWNSLAFFGASHDGSVVIGRVQNNSTFNSKPAMWTKNTGLQIIEGPYVDVDDLSCGASDISENGKVIVGTAKMPESGAFKWTESTGMVQIDERESLGSVAGVWIGGRKRTNKYNVFIPE